MITEITDVLNSEIFTQWLSNPNILINFLTGNHRKRELLIRDKIFCELERLMPGRYGKEKNYRDLVDFENNSICEFGHSGMFQNPHFVAGKCLDDYYKRKIKQNENKTFYTAHILTDIKKYNRSIKYQNLIDNLNKDRTRKYGNRTKRIIIINKDFAKIGNYELSNPLNFNIHDYILDLYYIITGPLNLNWSSLKNKYDNNEINLSRIENKYN